MSQFLLRVASWGALTILPAALNATDGVVRIDQAAAIAGNVTPGDGPGFPVTISQPGTYRLTGNLTVADGNAIQITADFVTLDLNGFSILGPLTCVGGPATTCPAAGSGVGIASGSEQKPITRGIRILNGTVAGMGSIGIKVTGPGSVVEKVTVQNNAGGGIAIDGKAVGSTATQNGSFGILAGSARDCTSTENAGDGIILNGIGGIAIGNVANENGGYGIVAPFATVTGNATALNKAAGIMAQCPASVVTNTIISTTASAIETRGAGCILANNATRQ